MHFEAFFCELQGILRCPGAPIGRKPQNEFWSLLSEVQGPLMDSKCWNQAASRANVQTPTLTVGACTLGVKAYSIQSSDCLMANDSMWSLLHYSLCSASPFPPPVLEIIGWPKMHHCHSTRVWPSPRFQDFRTFGLDRDLCGHTTLLIQQ